MGESGRSRHRRATEQDWDKPEPVFDGAGQAVYSRARAAEMSNQARFPPYTTGATGKAGPGMWRTGNGRWVGGALLALTAILALAACGTTYKSNLRPLPAGTYTSAAFHFKITYPSGWGYTVLSCGTDQHGGSGCDSLHGTTASTGPTPIPLQLSITREGVLTTDSPAVSELTVTVLDMSDSNVAAAAAGVATDPTLSKITLAGIAAFASKPLQQAIPGSNGTPSAITDTHTDYYLIHGGFEYQLSVDALSGDGSDAALQAMVQSFAFTA